MPAHGRNVALVLDPITGLVSPQFHVTFDTNFDTTLQIKVVPQWMIRAGFVTQASKPVPAKTAPKNRMQKPDEEFCGTKRQRDTALMQEGGPKGRERQQTPMQAPGGMQKQSTTHKCN